MCSKWQKVQITGIFIFVYLYTFFLNVCIVKSLNFTAFKWTMKAFIIPNTKHR